MQFNPPPGWPVPPGFRPSGGWLPDPHWPPAPPGWQFWTVDEVDAPALNIPPPSRSRGFNAAAIPDTQGRRKFVTTTRLLAGMAMLAVIGLVASLMMQTTPEPEPAMPPPEPGPVLQGVPDEAWAHMPTGGWVSPPGPLPSMMTPPPVPIEGNNLNRWQVFGGVDARFGADNTSVMLDTHDTTDTWKTKWSGIIAPEGPRCAVRHIHVRVRDLSHHLGVPGGYGIGLARLQDSRSKNPELDGWAVQYDFGQTGYRIAVYPDDSDVGLVSAQLDHAWHTVDLVDDTDGQVVESVDGATVVQRERPGTCDGQPVFRVWAGAAEFRDIEVS
jgi:hypothetical protein